MASVNLVAYFNNADTLPSRRSVVDKYFLLWTLNEALTVGGELVE